MGGLADLTCGCCPADEDVDVSKGLFSLPFMKRAAEKQKAAAQSHARELLAELDGVTHDEDAPKSGRRNFGLEGGTQVGLSRDPEGAPSGS